MRYSQFRDWLVERLPSRYEGLEFYPGPDLPSDTPNRFVLLSKTGGPGLDAEGLIDVRGWQVRCAGSQNDYDDAERLAETLDAIILNFNQSQQVGDTWLVSIYRTGGEPTQLTVDNADRTHFVASYLASVQSALV
jgi:hypothetical protein